MAQLAKDSASSRLSQSAATGERNTSINSSIGSLSLALWLASAAGMLELVDFFSLCLCLNLCCAPLLWLTCALRAGRPEKEAGRKRGTRSVSSNSSLIGPIHSERQTNGRTDEFGGSIDCARRQLRRILREIPASAATRRCALGSPLSRPKWRQASEIMGLNSGERSGDKVGAARAREKASEPIDRRLALAGGC